MIKHLSIREFQRNGTKEIKELGIFGSLFLMSRNTPIAKITPIINRKKRENIDLSKYLGAYKGVNRDYLKKIKNEWDF